MNAPVAGSWLGVYPKRPGAPLVLPGATLAEALGMPGHRRAPVLDPCLVVLLPLLAADLTQAQIGARLHVSEPTVKHRTQRLYAGLCEHGPGRARGRRRGPVPAVARARDAAPRAGGDA